MCCEMVGFELASCLRRDGTYMVVLEESAVNDWHQALRLPCTWTAYLSGASSSSSSQKVSAGVT